jgi:hypothetical protein
VLGASPPALRQRRAGFRPKSTSVSPTMTARQLSIHSTRSFECFPGYASTPTGSRSPAAYRCPSPVSPGEQPRYVRAAPGGLFTSDAVLLHEVIFGVGRRYEHRSPEPPHEAPRVPFVPRRRQHDRRLPPDASSSISHGGAMGSNRSRRLPSSIAYDETTWSDGSLGSQSGCGASQCQRPRRNSRTGARLLNARRARRTECPPGRAARPQVTEGGHPPIGGCGSVPVIPMRRMEAVRRDPSPSGGLFRISRERPVCRRRVVPRLVAPVGKGPAAPSLPLSG